MQKKTWIGLEGMEFYAFHGVYEEEQKIGGRYVVDIWVYTDAEKARLSDDLNGTVNYELIYNAVNNNMKKSVKLIEHLAQNILQEIKSFVAKDDFLRIKIKKMNPPLGGHVLASVVEIED